mmetsp:Transcript_20763/g.24751  ORF Transcript_20763/g.24751 Transcript_20763/m.24751 type:complete len:97 (+) Transcript_20763:13-303(+)
MEGLQIMGGEFLEVGSAKALEVVSFKADTNRRKDKSSSSESKSSSQQRTGVKNSNDYASIMQRIEVALTNSLIQDDDDDTEADTNEEKRRKTRAAA